jgi:hypothetical protein
MPIHAVHVGLSSLYSNVCLLEILLQTLQVSSSSLLQFRAISCSSSSISQQSASSGANEPVEVAENIVCIKCKRSCRTRSLYCYLDTLQMRFFLYSA